MTAVADKPATVEKAPVAPAVTPPVSPAKMRDAGQLQQQWFVEVNNGVTVADLLRPAFWAHCVTSRNLKHLAKIAVMPADGSYYAELLVRDVGRGYAVCALLNVTKLATDLEVPADADYDVKWAGPSAKFRVMRMSDKTVVSEGHVDKAEAQAWLTEHLKAFTR